MTFTFDEDMIIDALEANGWSNVWDIYWMREGRPDWGGMTTEDAFSLLLREKNLLPPRSAAAPGQPGSRSS